MNVVSVLMFVLVAGGGALAGYLAGSPPVIVAAVIIGVLAARSPQIAQQWERMVLLRLGRFVGLRGPGLLPTVSRLPSRDPGGSGRAPRW